MMIMGRRQPTPTLFPYTTLFRSCDPVAQARVIVGQAGDRLVDHVSGSRLAAPVEHELDRPVRDLSRSEEHTSELQSPCKIVSRLPHEKKKRNEYPKALYESMTCT